MLSDDTQKKTWLLSQLAAGNIDRREFIGRMVGLGVATGLASSLAGVAVAKSSPKKGGHLRFGMAHGETEDTLDPAHINNGYTTVVAYTITNMLTEEDADGNIRPKLAESWEPSDGAKKWAFKLRKGVEFHDGRTLKAQDVVASINHHRGPNSKSAAKSTVEPMQSVEAADDQTVVITLSGPDADIPAKLSGFSFGIYPANQDGTLDWQKGNGAGAYRLKQFTPGGRTTFEKNPNYWQADRGFFDSGELQSILDPAARQNALLTNAVDAIDRIDLKTATQLAKAEGVVVEEVKGKLHYTFPMRTDTAPFNDSNIRLALKYGINREAYLKTILFGHGAIGNDQPITPAYRFYSSNVEQRKYDPDKARFYLKQAGKSDLTVNLSASGAAYQNAVDAALLYKDSAAKAGININVVREPNDGYWGTVWMKKSWCASYWFGTPTADGILTIAYAGGASQNDTFWNNSKFNALLLQARGELDATKRAALYHDLQLLVHDDGGAVIPAIASDVFATRKSVNHGKLAASYEVDGRMFFDRWWFA